MKSRTDCPDCGRYKSVSITDDGTTRKWNCFGADCNHRGTEQKDLTVQSLETKKYTPADTFTEYFTDARSNTQALEYLQKYHCLEFYDYNKNVNIYWDNKLERVVFNCGETYTGRSIVQNSPKWFIYKVSDTPFIARSQEHGSTLLLVEDCTSACNAARLVDTLALQGTFLRQSYIEHILKYDRIIIALDEDATSKAFQMKQTLELLRPTLVMPLQSDIKYWDIRKLDKELHNATRGTLPYKTIP